MAISILATAFLTACGGGPSPTPSATPSATPVSNTRVVGRPTATDPEASASQPPLPGGRLVYIALNEDGDGSLVVTNLDGTDTNALLPAGNPPRWSPDGRHISVVADDVR